MTMIPTQTSGMITICLILPHSLTRSHHVHQVVESQLEADIHHVVRVGGGQDVVPGWVVPQQVHGQLVSEAGERIEK